MKLFACAVTRYDAITKDTAIFAAALTGETEDEARGLLMKHCQDKWPRSTFHILTVEVSRASVLAVADAIR